MPGGPTLEVKSSLLVAFSEFSLGYTLTLAHRNTECTKSVTDTSPLLRLEQTQVCICLFVLFFHPLGCVLCVRKEMYYTPGRRWEKSLDDSDGHLWFKEDEIVGSASGYWHKLIKKIWRKRHYSYTFSIISSPTSIKIRKNVVKIRHSKLQISIYYIPWPYY